MGRFSSGFSVMLVVLVGLSRSCGGARIALDIDARDSPFLRSTSSSSSSGGGVPQILTAPFTWSHMYLGKLLHQSRVVEIGPRGALFVAYEESTGRAAATPQRGAYILTACVPTPNALCSTLEGDVLPSALQVGGGEGPTVFNVSATLRLTRDPVLRALGRLNDACKEEGNGAAHAYAKDQEDPSAGHTYTVTACDVLQGTHVLVYEPRARRLTLRAQTCGPAAYVVVLFSAAMHIAALASDNPQAEWIFVCNGVASVLACAVLYGKGEVQFHTLEDEALFWVNGGCALVWLLVRRRDEGYLCALSMMAAALYRTHETPYAPILGYVLAYKVWGQLLGPKTAWIAVGELMLQLLYASVFCEIAVRPLYALSSGLWKLQLIFHLFITYCLAKFKELSGEGG